MLKRDIGVGRKAVYVTPREHVDRLALDEHPLVVKLNLLLFAGADRELLDIPRPSTHGRVRRDDPQDKGEITAQRLRVHRVFNEY